MIQTNNAIIMTTAINHKCKVAQLLLLEGNIHSFQTLPNGIIHSKTTCGPPSIAHKLTYNTVLGAAMFLHTETQVNRWLK